MTDDWVIIGQQMANGDGVIVFASSTITQVRLHELISLHGQDISVTAQLSDYLKIRAATYDEALRLLFDQWQPFDTPALDNPEG